MPTTPIPFAIRRAATLPATPSKSYTPTPQPDPFLHAYLQTKLGSLHLTSILGGGTFGVVYLAQHASTNDFYAVKRIPSSERTLDDPYFAGQVEYYIHQRVHAHPNIATLYDIQITAHSTFIVMEYCERTLLSLIMEWQTALQHGEYLADREWQVTRLFSQVLHAIRWCHTQSVYHRDLKPENVLLTRIDGQWHAKVTDFGLATMEVKTDELGCGSPLYMAPESLKRSSLFKQECTDRKRYAVYTAPLDVWALGMLLSQMCLLAVPWIRAHPQLDKNYAYFVREPTPTRLQNCAQGMSKELSVLLWRMLDVRRRRRAGVEEVKRLFDLVSARQKLVKEHEMYVDDIPDSSVEHEQWVVVQLEAHYERMNFNE
jgi:serine/threonine protein kinase